ncbi:uncharacterized protein [Palaemon carinicauda]|uniref:uncharacterized protein n=1 Tax=Palaemon carinicauda TaxID=392227 RepID=UPI0035B64CA0
MDILVYECFHQALRTSQPQEPLLNDQPSRHLNGGPQFTSIEFGDFTESWYVQCTSSLAHYQQSDGDTDYVIKAVKLLFLKMAPSGNIDGEAFDNGFLELLNMPNLCGHSHAQILYGHPLQKCLPAHPQSFMECLIEKTHDYDCRAASRFYQVKHKYNIHARPCPD